MKCKRAAGCFLVLQYAAPNVISIEAVHLIDRNKCYDNYKTSRNRICTDKLTDAIPIQPEIYLKGSVSRFIAEL